MEIEDKTEPILTDTERTLLQIQEAHPEYTDAQLAKHTVDIGALSHPQSAYRVLKKGDYLRLKLAELRSRLHEDHTRTIMPLAHKRLKKALKNKELGEKEAFPYVKLAYDKGMADKEEPSSQVQVNIEEMRQIIIDGTKRGE